MKKNTKIVHAGRAANCVCAGLPGKRCPDCNHLLDGRTSMDMGDETSAIETERVKCSVCGKDITSENLTDVKLEVHNMKATQKGVITNG